MKTVLSYYQNICVFRRIDENAIGKVFPSSLLSYYHDNYDIITYISNIKWSRNIFQDMNCLMHFYKLRSIIVFIM